MYLYYDRWLPELQKIT